jgi:cytochrome P450
MDLISDFAYPLPATVIAELLGVPPEDRDTYRQWADVIVGLEENSDINYIKKVSKTFDEMDIYFSKLIEEKKKKKIKKVLLLFIYCCYYCCSVVI